MAGAIKINPFSKVNNDTGFSTKAPVNGVRFLNQDGTFNVQKTGLSFFQRFSLFHAMLQLPLWQFLGLLLAVFLGVNLLYTFVYCWIGAQQFTGIIGKNSWQVFKEIYFFSCETFTTVGYGRVNPVGDGANLLASIEAMTGFLSFALATGLIFGRFARPRAHLLFSNHAVIAPYRSGNGLMFRFACYKQHHILTDVSIRVNLAMLVQKDGKMMYEYFQLPLERSKVDNLPMNWTVVHPIDEESPLLGLSRQDLQDADVEIYVMVRGFNDVYANTTVQRTSYTFNEIHFNRAFTPMFEDTPAGTVLELDKISKSKPLS
ncbi:inward rectifier potassium channel [Filimonas lacunae]|uniref:Inward rectifier potassium channel n=1 Tax=Filimonas lacunae TaxID=477680 RepID=A0A173MMG2_9BACT|nr:ion channel [Filimonas lacunae]BAV08676.1 Kef-type K+ transport systems, predicted NAD-binding component [Filimonas lacunae]SIS59795.1 inward rectifier potassium channel [Filimonas lacunae]